MVEDLGRLGQHRLHAPPPPPKSGTSTSTVAPGSRGPDRPDGRHVVRGPPSRQIVPGHRRDHHVRQPQPGHRLGHLLRLRRVQRRRRAAGDPAEAAVPSADVPMMRKVAVPGRSTRPDWGRERSRRPCAARARAAGLHPVQAWPAWAAASSATPAWDQAGRSSTASCALAAVDPLTPRVPTRAGLRSAASCMTSFRGNAASCRPAAAQSSYSGATLTSRPCHLPHLTATHCRHRHFHRATPRSATCA